MDCPICKSKSVMKIRPGCISTYKEYCPNKHWEITFYSTGNVMEKMYGSMVLFTSYREGEDLYMDILKRIERSYALWKYKLVWFFESVRAGD